MNHLPSISALPKKIYRILQRARGKTQKPIGFEPTLDWFRHICQANTHLLRSSCITKNGSNLGASKSLPVDPGWKTSLSAFGAALCYKYHHDETSLNALDQYFAVQIDSRGNWIAKIENVEHAMKGYALLLLNRTLDRDRYSSAAHSLAETLINEYPRLSDGSLPYQSFSQEILVDTLAMVCPFLAKYGMAFDNQEAVELGVKQLVSFTRNNVDANSYLPYHGYYADGPWRLGLHGWGRGTGWYMTGLVDTLAELPSDYPAYAELHHAFIRAATTMLTCQRADGHWNWAALHRQDHLDSSTTALVGYSLMRGLAAGILDTKFQQATTAALRALAAVTRVDGILDQGLGECRGLGKYPQTYGPQIWLQGTATAFAALYFNHLAGIPS